MAHSLLAALLAFAVVYVVLFSSFFTHWPGVLDGVRTFLRYLERGTGGEPLHVHPWHWYFNRLFFYQSLPRATWFSEAIIGVLAMAGIISAALRRGVHGRHIGFARFLAVYTIVLTAAYCAIPYKTPWCVLSFLHGMILLAGIGAVAAVRNAPGWWGKSLLVIILLAAGGDLLRQSYRANFELHTHRLNPWVYAHSAPKVREIDDQIRKLAAIAGPDMKVLFVSGEQNLWPIPFYLRCAKVSWFTGVPADVDAHVLVVPMDAAVSVAARHRERYEGWHYYVVRPDIDSQGQRLILHVAMFVRRDLWERFMADR